MTASKMYIDFEGKEPKQIEVGAVIDCGGELKAFLRLVKPAVLGWYDNDSASYSNCIPDWRIIGKGIPERVVWRELSQIITELERPAEILGFGSDVDEASLRSLLPRADFSGIVFSQVPLEEWSKRGACAFHLGSKELAQRFRWCPSHTLEYRLSPKDLRSNLSDAQKRRRDAKWKHGAHCAFSDSLELLMVDQKQMVTPGQLEWMHPQLRLTGLTSQPRCRPAHHPQVLLDSVLRRGAHEHVEV